MQRAPLLMALVLAVLLAGCSTAPSTNNNSTAGGPDFPQTLSDVNLNGTHAQSLRDAGSFTTEYEVTISTNDSSTMLSELTFGETVKADLTDKQYLKTSSGGLIMSGETAKFTNATATYKRSGSGDDATYEKATAPYEDDSILALKPVNVTEAMGVSYFTDWSNSTEANVSLELTGTTQFKGDTVGVYELSSESEQAIKDAIDEEMGSDDSSFGSNAKLLNTSMTVYLDQNDTVRHVALSMAMLDTEKNARYDMSIRQNWTAIGQTDVQKPDWVATAVQKAEESSGSDYSWGDDNSTEDTESCYFLNTDLSASAESNPNGSTTVTIAVTDMANAQNLTVETSVDEETLATITTEGTTTITVPADKDVYSLDIKGHTEDGCSSTVSYVTID